MHPRKTWPWRGWRMFHVTNKGDSGGCSFEEDSGDGEEEIEVAGVEIARDNEEEDEEEEEEEVSASRRRAGSCFLSVGVEARYSA